MPLFTLIATHAAMFVLLLLAAAGAGTLVLDSRAGLALRSALGLALWAHALFFLALIGQLRAVPMLVLLAISLSGVVRGVRLSLPLLFAIASFAPLFLLALHPPLAFDETLYHLPMVRELAQSGQLRFVADLRFPVFPQLHELLSVPLFLLAGDVATHLVALAEVLITAGLLFEWGRRRELGAGWLAAAIFAGSPIVLHLATITYADAALTLFVTAGFCCLDRGIVDAERRWSVLAGLFLGTACSVKYLGGYFAVAALLVLVLLRRRAVLPFAVACAAAALPTTLWLFVTTGDAVFPFWSRSVWTLPTIDVAPATRFVGTLRLVWDVAFARERLNAQPPFTPWFIAVIAIVASVAVRDVRVRCVAIMATGYAIIFSFLPQDSRYLVPLLPLLGLCAAVALTKRWPKAAPWLAILAIAPGLAYVAYRVTVAGVPPATPQQRRTMLLKRIPEYDGLLHAGSSVYVCGAEQLKYHASGKLLGDHNGPYSYDRVLAGEVAENLRRLDMRSLLIAKRVCGPRFRMTDLTLVFEDDATQVWRVASRGR